MGIPVIDVSALVSGQAALARVAAEIDAACRDVGFFAVVGHGVDAALCERLDRTAREFFALEPAEKEQIAMSHGGHAWRGWFPLGGELTSGVPDRKEGIYFGAEEAADGRPLRGPNLFPTRPAQLRDAVLEFCAAMTDLGHAITRGMALGLGLDSDWFARELTGDPTILFRIFHYPPEHAGAGWGVAEHTDYGLLTILMQDRAGGLEVRGREGWTDVAPIPDAFVCNLGDMLERMTGGRYRSTPHRVRNRSDRGRLSFPFFFDPAWDARVRPIPQAAVPSDTAADRWDGASVHEFGGTYGEYLLAKVAKVFPGLADEVIAAPERAPGRRN
ncbi:MAG: isopenicillin N synthase family dioxygenase [Actinomycetota bacterium]